MIGTLNAIIFYANIVAANKSAFFPSGVSPASVFISRLNFDLGFDACFFDGMDTYIKTWLQLAFPAYIIILVVMIIGPTQLLFQCFWASYWKERSGGHSGYTDLALLHQVASYRPSSQLSPLPL